MTTPRRLLGNERGSILPGTIAGSLLNLIVLGIIAAAISGQAFLHLNMSKRSAQISAVALSDTTLRSDIAWAGKVTANPGTLILESSVDGRCRTAAWAVIPEPAGARLERTTSFSDTFAADGGCGPSYGASKETMIDGIDPASAFGYRLDGRIHLATLDVTTGFKTKNERTYAIVQAAAGLYSAPSGATAPGTQVPEGNLR